MRTLAVFWLTLFAWPVVADVSGGVEIDMLYARPAFKLQGNSAAYMQLHNKAENASLVSASSDAARVVELHTHTQENGVLRMRKIDRIDLPAGQAVLLQPGGLHIMLIGLQRDLIEGDRVDVTLQFNDGSTKALSAPIQRTLGQQGYGHKTNMEQ